MLKTTRQELAVPDESYLRAPGVRRTLPCPARGSSRAGTRRPGGWKITTAARPDHSVRNSGSARRIKKGVLPTSPRSSVEESLHLGSPLRELLPGGHRLAAVNRTDLILRLRLAPHMSPLTGARP
jgi:hypothetical protein